MENGNFLRDGHGPFSLVVDAFVPLHTRLAETLSKDLPA